MLILCFSYSITTVPTLPTVLQRKMIILILLQKVCHPIMISLLTLVKGPPVIFICSCQFYISFHLSYFSDPREVVPLCHCYTLGLLLGRIEIAQNQRTRQNTVSFFGFLILEKQK